MSFIVTKIAKKTLKKKTKKQEIHCQQGVSSIFSLNTHTHTFSHLPQKQKALLVASLTSVFKKFVILCGMMSFIVNSHQFSNMPHFIYLENSSPPSYGLKLNWNGFFLSLEIVFKMINVLNLANRQTLSNQDIDRLKLLPIIVWIKKI